MRTTIEAVGLALYFVAIGRWRVLMIEPAPVLEGFPIYLLFARPPVLSAPRVIATHGERSR
jgi:hypothetical protein